MKKLLVIFSIISMMSCKKDQKDLPAPVTEELGSVVFKFDNTVNGVSINLDTATYYNALNQPYIIKAWKYFVSNVKFYKDGNLVFQETDSYHYINEDKPETLEFTVQDVPVGEYNEIRYSFGIDSINNTETASSGDIDPGTGMFWPMGGYRFSNFDGESGSTGLAFHVGGNSNYFEMAFDTDISLIIENNKSSQVLNNVDINKMFSGVNDIDFTQTPNLATEGTAKPIVENMKLDMFEIVDVLNP